MTCRSFLLPAVASLAACGGGGGFPDAPIDVGPLPPGNFTLAWSLTDTMGAAITCEQIGAQSVTAILRDPDAQGGFTEVFTCQTGMGTSQGLAPASYDVRFELVGVGGPPPDQVIATAPSQLSVPVVSGQSVALEPLTFAVDATGGLKLHLASGATGGNCGDVAASGAGITTMTITLDQMGGATCAPVTFAIGAGATLPAGTYTVDCTTPLVTGCIESDQELSVTGVASGSYAIHVRGYRDLVVDACFTNDDTLPVPPLGRDLVRTLNLGQQTLNPACQ